MEPLLAEIKIFAGNFAPKGWYFCDGTVLSIAQNTALFSLLGTTYGGDGVTTFKLPDLRGRVPIHVGNGQPGPGLSAHTLGEMGGTETNTLKGENVPAHMHTLAGTAQIMAKNANGDSINPGNGTVLGIVNDGQRDPIQHPMYATSAPDTALSNQSIGGTTGATGGGQPFNNMQPYLAINYIIAWQGVYPSRP
ncbi:MAG: phage tail protein [Chitinophagaceae bacterium]|nr:MAG: phage tail protein [Chitinophagaceae bacterium]